MLIFKYRFPLYATMLICAAAVGATWLLFKNAPLTNDDEPSQAAINYSPPPPSFHEARLKGYSYISPLMFVETPAKSSRFEAVRQLIASYIENKKQIGDVEEASFYLRDNNAAEWTGYNEDEKYHPGSLMKVPELISILRLEEQKPGTLNKQLFYAAPYIADKEVRYHSKQLQPGKSYSVRELLYHMIAYSDNNATMLLDLNLDQRIFNKTLTDVGLPAPQPDSVNYPISAKSFSLFMREIYNAAYLTIPHSEYAAELLSNIDFPDGFAKGLPKGTKLIQKFGESGTIKEPQLHESAIIYVNGKAYTLTVMSKGTDLNKLAPIITDIARMVYEEISKL